MNHYIIQYDLEEGGKLKLSMDIDMQKDIVTKKFMVSLGCKMHATSNKCLVCLIKLVICTHKAPFFVSMLVISVKNLIYINLHMTTKKCHINIVRVNKR